MCGLHRHTEVVMERSERTLVERIERAAVPPPMRDPQPEGDLNVETLKALHAAILVRIYHVIFILGDRPVSVVNCHFPLTQHSRHENMTWRHIVRSNAFSNLVALRSRHRVFRATVEQHSQLLVQETLTL